MFGVGLGGGFGDEFGGGGMFGMGRFNAMPAGNGAFSRRLRVHSMLDIGRAELENGDKIVLPPSALDVLSRLHIQFPMMFRIESAYAFTHCGVIEFVAEEGHAYIPSWMISRLGLTEGSLVTLSNVNLPKGTDVTFQPQTVDFLDISNPKVVLEASLRNFTCLSVNDKIPIHYNNKTYWIDVTKLQPGNAVSIVEADVRTEFEAPPGYVEPSAPVATADPAALSSSFSNVHNNLVDGTNKRADAKDTGDSDNRLKQRLFALRKKRTGNREDAESESSSSSDGEVKTAPKVQPFSGAGHVLAGNVRRGSAAVVSRKLEADASENVAKKEFEPKSFTPFGGTGRSLKE
eukprot:CAMPEP_0182445170 /NCGR_PEP_ID=MMETSP1172-20130603/3392_1 /TAXON_ID=708627 /ORGANISM="Timspurckia oligopyrenoides, Strain CCMP3278" /LENGTH=345 /DNA_ID=CAMNT_0024640889 /DNA_START=58 /DNA_END=1095 /DNA_ORIENTATION=-